MTASAPSAAPTLDPALCPLCGSPNRCTMAAEQATGITQAACWCRDAAIDPAVLAQIPPTARGKACICAACAAGGDKPG